MNGINLTAASDIRIGSTQSSAVYLGANKIWPVQHDYSKDYLTIVSLEDNNEINLYSIDAPRTIQVSTDNGSTWVNKTASSSGTLLATLNTGDKLLLKGNNSSYASGIYNDSNYFRSSKTFNIEGNIMSLIYEDNFVGQTALYSSYTFTELFCICAVVNAENLILPATTLAEYCYYGMFNGCTSLVTAPELPATTLSEYCYYRMFLRCTSLTTAPELPATTLAKYCYADMFEGCTSLTTAPKLHATTLAEYCYYYMFRGCTSLTTAPELPATTLAEHCYTDMFRGCTSLTTAPELPATTLAASCYAQMFRGCTSLTTAPELPVTTLQIWCYSAMFEGCTSLTTAPELPATTLAEYCYAQMFDGCTSLVTAPELPATTLAKYCYAQMFQGCTSLVTAPELPATTLTEYCYDQMFGGCSSLNYIKCLATDISANYCTYYWVDNVAAIGTFVKDPNMTSWTTGTSGIPSGWTIQNDYSKDYLTIVSLEDNNEIKFVHKGNEPCTIQVSTDNGSTWVNKTASSSGTLLATLNTGDKLLLKGYNNTYTLTTNSNMFISTKSFNLEGNIMSLIYEDNFVGQTTLPSPYINTFMRLFKSSYVVSAEHLILPATTLVDYCYSAMFEGCTSLVTAPELPATTLVDSCYYGMFNGCSSLNYIKCLATDISANYCTNWWVDNVAATGTFVKDPNMTSWTTGKSGIPSGWTIQNA